MLNVPGVSLIPEECEDVLERVTDWLARVTVARIGVVFSSTGLAKEEVEVVDCGGGGARFFVELEVLGRTSSSTFKFVWELALIFVCKLLERGTEDWADSLFVLGRVLLSND